jgi:hypothetical protein
VSKGEAVGGKVIMPLNSLFNQRLYTYMQVTASRHESPLSFTLRWRGLIATTVNTSSSIAGIGCKTACRLLVTLEWLTPAAFAGCIREPSMPKEFKEEVLTVGQDGNERLLNEYMLPTMDGSGDEPKIVPTRERTRERRISLPVS